MKTIWKYQISAPRQILSVPYGAEILTAQWQTDCICIWFIVEPSLPKEIRTFEVIGTGHDIDKHKRNYISTIQIPEDRLGWHIFEILS